MSNSASVSTQTVWTPENVQVVIDKIEHISNWVPWVLIIGILLILLVIGFGIYWIYTKIISPLHEREQQLNETAWKTYEHEHQRLLELETKYKELEIKYNALIEASKDNGLTIDELKNSLKQYETKVKRVADEYEEKIKQKNRENETLVEEMKRSKKEQSGSAILGAGDYGEKENELMGNIALSRLAYARWQNNKDSISKFITTSAEQLTTDFENYDSSKKPMEIYSNSFFFCMHCGETFTTEDAFDFHRSSTGHYY